MKRDFYLFGNISIIRKLFTQSLNFTGTLLFSTALVYCGNATEDNIPIIKTTTNNSIKVKPFLFIKYFSFLIKNCSHGIYG